MPLSGEKRGEMCLLRISHLSTEHVTMLYNYDRNTVVVVELWPGHNIRLF